MANKYLIHGATYCGDGTASNEAASAGAAGAWNNINVFEGTAPAYGSLASGDTVYIRSKTGAGADANISTTLSASKNLGSSAATASKPITWIIDGGTIWTGVSGSVTYQNGSNLYCVGLGNNVIRAEVQDALIFKNTATSPTGPVFYAYGVIANALFDFAAKTSTSDIAMVMVPNGAVLVNPHLVIGKTGTNPGYYPGLITCPDYVSVLATIINPVIELSGTTVGQTIFNGGANTSSTFNISGGSISGTAATTGANVLSPGGGSNAAFSIVGLKIPRTMSICTGYNQNIRQCDISLCDGGFGGHHEASWGWATSRTDNNPPYLNAELPDSAGTKWSTRVYPSGATPATPMLLRSAKTYSGTAAALTITQEVLVSTDFTTQPNKKTLWIEVDYTDDSTGLKKTISSFDSSASGLDSSTAGWSATTWGAVSFNKRKLSVTTPTSVKQDTPITVTLVSIQAAPSANAIYFVDQDFGVV